MVKSIGEGCPNAGEQLNAYLAEVRSKKVKAFDPNANYLMERSVTSSYLFAMADGSSEETMNKIFHSIVNTPEPALAVYIRCPAHICKKRIRKRGRDGEEGLSMKYLREIERVHDEWSEVGEELHRVLIVDHDEMSVSDLARLIKTKLEVVAQYNSLYEKRQTFKR